MLLIWLLVIPSVATFVCKGACELCAMDRKPQSPSCALCRDCKRSESLRMMAFTNTIPILSDQQKKDLRDLEKAEFKKVMHEYGLKPEDLINTDAESSMEDNRTTTTDPEACVDPVQCYIKSAEDISGKILVGSEKPSTVKNKCRNTDSCSQRFTPKGSANPTHCPPVTPCKKVLKKITQTDGHTSSTLPPYESILNRMVTPRDSDYDLNDQGCPTQPICSDYEDYEMRVTKRGSVSANINTKTCPKKLLKLLATTPPCVTCMPFCQQPCAIITSMPQEARGTITTLKPMRGKKIPHESSEITKISTEGTTKDYIYVYVGVPKDVKHVRKV